MTHLIAVLCEKGGTKKTFLSVHLTEALRARRANVAIADVDFLNSGLIPQIFPDALRVNPLYRTELLELFTRIKEGQSVVLDGGANVGFRLFEFLKEEEPVLAEDLHRAGVRVTVIVPLSGDAKALKSPSIYRDMFPHAEFIMAFPRHMGDDFEADPVVAPPGFTDCPAFDIPPAPPALVRAYLKHRRSFNYIAGAQEPAFAELRPFAIEYLEQLNKQFEHILPQFS